MSWCFENLRILENHTYQDVGYIGEACGMSKEAIQGTLKGVCHDGLTNEIHRFLGLGERMPSSDVVVGCLVEENWPEFYPLLSPVDITVRYFHLVHSKRLDTVV